MSGPDPYLEAARAIPAGETRTFLEVAAMAGRPGAARAAGRALRKGVGRRGVPWHRVVRQDGRPWCEPAGHQVRRLRHEGARPRAGEATRAWARRVGCALVGRFRDRRLASAGDPEVDAWPELGIEPLPGEAAAAARGFTRTGGPPEPLWPRPHREPPRAYDAAPLSRRVGGLDWPAASERIATRGACAFRALLTPAECSAILADAARPRRFERTIDMLPKGYGVGTYHYFAEPLPRPLHRLRGALYPRLLPLADRLAAAAGAPAYPQTLAAFHARCRDAGQRRASSIVLCYGPGGVNHPHRDLYGRIWFPLQVLALLSERGRDFDGGSFVLLGDDGARHELAPTLGDVVVFCSSFRLDGRRRVPVRHGMSSVTRGRRQAAGIVFHLAQ